MDGVSVLEDAAAEMSGVLRPGGEAAQIPPESLALGGVLGVVLALIGLLPLLARGARSAFGLGAWGLWGSLARAALGLLAARMILRFWLLALPADLQQSFSLVSFDPPPALLVTEMCFAIADLYGLLPLFLFMCCAVPLVEELVFRGLLLEGLSRHVGFAWANVVQATLFAAMHEAWVAFPFFLGLGLIAGAFARRSGSLLVPLVLHFANNGLVFLVIAARVVTGNSPLG